MFQRSLSGLLAALCFSVGLAGCGGGSKSGDDLPAEFSINGAKGTASGNEITIDLTASDACVKLTDLSIAVTAAGATVSPDPGTVRDFSQPVVFTLTATDGGQVVGYTVTVKATPCSGSSPKPVASSPRPGACRADPVGSSGYSQVFMRCNTKNVPNYFDKTECVRDNATGLIWEGKTTSGLRASGNKYNNFDNLGLLQVASRFSPSIGAIPARAPTQAEVDAGDNSTGYKNRVNATRLCGFSDWRIPTRDELLSIRKEGDTTLIDFVWFPNTDWDGYYATSTQYGAEEDKAWVVQFYQRGAFNVDHLSRDGAIFHPTLGPLELRNHSVRLVR